MAFYNDIVMTFLSVFIIMCGALYWYIIRKYQYWNNKNVKSRLALPIVGSYTENLAMKTHPVQINQDVYNMYKNEKLVGGFRGTKPELIIRDPDIVRSILIKDFNYFYDRSTPVKRANILTQNLFSLHGERWRLLRQKLTPTFTSSKMRLMFPLILECGEELISHIKKTAKGSQEIEVKEAMAKFTTDTIGTCAFGLKINSMADENNPFRKIGLKIFKVSKWMAFLRLIRSFIPLFDSIFFYINMFMSVSPLHEIESFFVNIVKQIVTSRESSSVLRNDFMDLMIELKNKGSLPIDGNEKLVVTDEKEMVITDELIVAQAFVFFLAGFETSSTTMSYALLELARNPEVQTKLALEIDAVLKKNNDKLSYDALQEMKYLDMVINETLRKYPPLGVLQRISASEYFIKETQTKIDKGVDIIIPIYAFHKDEKYFPEPEKFLPERFSPESATTVHPFSYLPFGDGPRNCIGFRFGKLQTSTGLASVLKHYTVEPCNRTPSKVVFDPSSPVLACKDGVWLQLKPRQ